MVGFQLVPDNLKISPPRPGSPPMLSHPMMIGSPSRHTSSTTTRARPMPLAGTADELVELKSEVSKLKQALVLCERRAFDEKAELEVRPPPCSCT